VERLKPINRIMLFKHKGTIKVPQNQELNQNLVNNSPLNVTVSIYKSYRDNVGTKCNLFAFLTSNRYRQQVEAIRTVTDKKQRDNLKSKLPAVTVSGLFEPIRLDTNIKQHANLLCLDFDSLPADKLAELWQLLACQPFVAYIGYSVSGEGIFAVVPIASGNNLLQHFFALEAYFFSFGFRMDKTCKNLSRLRGASYTERPYINHTASTYTDVLSDSVVPAEKKDDTPPAAQTTPRPKHTSTNATPTDKAVQIATDAATKKGLMFADGSRTNYTVFVAGLLNRFGIEQNEAFYALDSVIGIAHYPDHKKRFFDVYGRYQHEHNTTHFTATYQQQPTPPTKKDAPPAAAPPAAKKVFAPLQVKPLHTIKYTKYLSDSPEFETMCCLMLLSGNRFWQFCSPTRSGKTYAFTRLFIAVVTALHPDKKVCFINPLRTPTDQVTSENPDLNTDIAVFDHSIFTWDKGLLFLLKHIDRINDIIIIVDEAHDLIKAASPKYKAKQIGQLYSYLKFAFKVICLSGTPFGIMEQLGYTTLKAEPTTANKYKPEQITTTAANIPTELINLLKANKDKKSLIFCNSATSTSPTSAEQLSKLANICNLKSDFVWSGNKLSNANSLYIQSHKVLPAEVDNIFCTAVFETGLTVEVDNVVYINDKPEVELFGIWQSLSRNTTFKTRNITVITVPINEPEHPQFDFIFSNLQNEIADHQKLADLFTAQHNLLSSSSSLKNYTLPATDISKGAIVWSEPEQKYIVIPLVLLCRQYPNITQSYTHHDLSDFLAQLTQTDVIHHDRTNDPTNEAISEISQEIKAHTKEQRDAAKETITELLTEPNTTQHFLNTVYTLTENSNLKRNLLSFGTDTMHNLDTDSTTLYQQNIKVCETAANRYTYLKKRYLNTIPTDNLSLWCVESSYNYGVILERLSYTVIRLLTDTYGDADLETMLKDDKAKQKIEATRKKTDCLQTILAAQRKAESTTPPTQLTASDVLSIVRAFEPKTTPKGLNSYLSEFCEPTSSRKGDTRLLNIETLNYDNLMDINKFLDSFEGIVF
jgi:hypothetical protein